MTRRRKAVAWLLFVAAAILTFFGIMALRGEMTPFKVILIHSGPDDEEGKRFTVIISNVSTVPQLLLPDMLALENNMWDSCCVLDPPGPEPPPAPSFQGGTRLASRGFLAFQAHVPVEAKRLRVWILSTPDPSSARERLSRICERFGLTFLRGSLREHSFEFDP